MDVTKRFTTGYGRLLGGEVYEGEWELGEINGHGKVRTLSLTRPQFWPYLLPRLC
jgi:hypothetical protein